MLIFDLLLLALVLVLFFAISAARMRAKLSKRAVPQSQLRRADRAEIGSPTARANPDRFRGVLVHHDGLVKVVQPKNATL
jgi:hypothetical protein